MKYTVIGNGIIALTAAFRLTQKMSEHDELVVIGPSDRVGSASCAAAAMLNSFAEIGEGSLKTGTSLLHFELSHRATQEWPGFERELIAAAGINLPKGCKDCQVETGGCFDKGTYILNNTASDDLDDKNFNAIVTALEDFNEQYEFVDPLGIPNYYPAQHKRASRALYIHNEGWLNPRLVLEKLDRILLADSRVEVIDGAVSKLVEVNGRISQIFIDNGSVLESDIVLVANGASSGDLLAASGLNLPIQKIFYGVGVSLQIQSPGYPHEKCIRTPNRGGACGVYTAPLFLGPDQPKDHVVVGASNYLSPVPVYNGRLISIEHLMNSAIEEINGYFYNAQMIRCNVGWRPTTQDMYPLLGRTSIENLYCATGTKRDGFHLSPVISSYISDMMLGKDVDVRLDVFSPERSVIRELDRESAIRLIVDSLMSEQYQHGYVPSNVRMNAQVRENYRQDIEQLHDKIGAVDWGIPSELVNMYRRGYVE
ncbi:NAD(P)/FAD-dependent oxidoreductase [Thalassospira alkalitolerans]|uniref:NAD(P)/FAD-dependent oxidoreductase n=1 Tax=Thalassospira alkalitolerans TaxID=1293890 RepID=UPI003AA8B7D2